MGSKFTIINNGEQQKQISNDVLEEYLSNGWNLGKLKSPWNKGLTVDDDERVAQNVKALRKYYDNITPEQYMTIKENLRNKKLGKKWSPEAIAKRTESRKGFISSQEQRQKTSQKLKGHLVSEETRNKISRANKGHPGVPCSDANREYLSKLHSSDEYQKQQNETKKKNGTFNTSKPEQKAYNLLKSVFGEDVEYSYRDIRYPYNCDFYIKSRDLFIELNYLWTHGGEPFNEENIEHIKKLEIWKNKAIKSNYYKNAIYTWTKLDKKKQETAKRNNLNYLMFYTERDFNIWFEHQATELGTIYANKWT